MRAESELFSLQHKGRTARDIVEIPAEFMSILWNHQRIDLFDFDITNCLSIVYCFYSH